MKEREQILALWHQLRAQGAGGVLITVVKTLGSSYRRPGARLLITQSGQRAGSISGGCLEDDVIKKAWWLSEKGPAIRRYDTTPDGDIGSIDESSGGFGLGCNGIIYLLIQRVSASDESGPLHVLDEVHKSRRNGLLAHVLGPPPKVGTLTADLMTEAQATSASSLADNCLLGTGGCEVFYETLTPPIRLLICGAGDDAVPLSELGSSMGWQVSIFDGRAHYARRERFPCARQVFVTDADTTLEAASIDDRCVAVIMTHSYSQDLNFLKALTKEPIPYLGLLGPRNRSEQLLTDAGMHRWQIPALRSPAGLDIGADGPEQVALSIVAEIQATMNSREGGPLRERVGSIHSISGDGKTSSKFVRGIVCA